MSNLSTSTLAPFEFSETWTLTRGGFIGWGVACFIALVCMFIFRARPSNGLCLTYAQYFSTHFVLITTALVMDGLNLAKEKPLVAGNLAWWIDILMVLAGGVFYRLFAILVFRVKGCAFSSASWVLTAMVWGALSTLQYFNHRDIAYFTVTAFYSLGCLLFLLAVIKEWCKTMCCKPKSRKPTTAKSCLAGTNGKIITSLGLVGVVVGILDYAFLIMAAFNIKIWEYEFLSRLLDSVIYIPFVVVFIIWADCPTNIKLKKDGDDLKTVDDIEADTGINMSMANGAFDEKSAL